jgi:hypothetical protein
MRRTCRHGTLLVPLLFFAFACSDSPTAPPATQLAPVPPERSILTPFILPPGADWGHYFVSFNRDRTLDVSVIHYPSRAPSGRGTVAIPQVGIGLLFVTSAAADPTQGCTPDGSPCGTFSNVPEGSNSSGIAFLNGRPGTFALHLQSNYWPNPTNTYDTATLTLCVPATVCRSYDFAGELHHEPSP